MEYYAHSDGTKNKKFWQKLRNHLEAVADLAGKFGEKFGSKEPAFVAGLLHDIGKYSAEFQARLEGAAKRVDHSTFGAQEILSLYKKPIGYLLAYVIAGHHSGLPDGGSVADDSSLEGRLKKTGLPNCSGWTKEIASIPDSSRLRPNLRPINGQLGFCLSFYIRMLYSCLVDADFLDTERFIAAETFNRRGGWPTLSELMAHLDQYLDTMSAAAPDTPVNCLRKDILAHCREKANNQPGFFTLTVPTGGGKTLSSLAFALRHAVRHGLERIIYVIPYTSIIEQTADVFRSALGREAVLEHHSNFQYNREDDEDWQEISEKLKLSAENWDAPIIVTTNVQFFESLFANRSSKCRKLHNLARSVIILDEAQMLPTDYLKPCLAALIELVTNYSASVILCTATQPALNRLMPESICFKEIASDIDKLYEAFRRVKVSFIGEKTDAAVVEQLSRHEQVLCIVNTRRHARMLYEQLKSVGDVYHLSARMCPVHRTEKLKEIREILANGKPCRLVSTQLIEAGVNIDFPVVYRAAAGIDSVAQAAGRCNREGRLRTGHVFVFKPEKHGLPGGWFSRTAEIAGMVMREFDDPMSLAAVRRYFEYLFDIDREELDKQRILQLFRENEKHLLFPFTEVANKFKLIDSKTVSIIIPWDKEAKELIRELQFTNYPAGMARRFQPYTVQVYTYEFAELLRTRAIRTVAGMYHILDDSRYYDEQVGLLTPESTVLPEEVLIF
ncbi:metal dependent phosphohydrolase [Desulfotomaculum nigrificans CO-1-SRB]|uniref:Metal dependent phosphohydrolase n=1 Tax=Desulfotomaculum nigrificans (strain DSM 14880 / VKM B-2319 / CO-1-SRB) TaxID=868595 RepID=F6B7Q4_DESCC|nr:CRISPR-associated helicase/endonuclease Cas3 [Desulfotomaculum nigrificans]AEF93426.1 metal dependent phosphohydrolase [Desulfotomaculum nigrificans CO-1-SRB]